VTPWRIITGSEFDDWIYWHLLLQLQRIITAQNYWLLKTRFIPYWTTSVFSSAVTDLVPIYWSVTYSTSVVCWLTRNSLTLNFWILLRITNELSWTELSSQSQSQSQSYVTTDGQSASLSWNKAPIWGLIPDLYYCMTVAGLLVWGALSLTRGRVCRLPESQFTTPNSSCITACLFVVTDTCFSEPLSSNGLFRVYPLPRERMLIS
jgi:hypothetical protein